MKIKYVLDNLDIKTDNVVLIGSSSSLKKLSKEKLDFLNKENTYCIRFNRAPVKNYENIVGNKTDLRVVNCHVFNNEEIPWKKNNNKEYPGQEKNFVKNIRNTNVLYIAPRVDPLLRKNINCHSSNNLYVFDYGKINNLKNEVGCNYSQQMSIGAVMISLCVISGIKPYICGFDIDLNLSNNRTHYWEERPKNPGASHNISKEILFFNQLINDGKLQLL